MQWLAPILALVVIIFNVGGFVWLSRNHFQEVNRRLDAHQELLTDISNRLSVLEGVWEGRKIFGPGES